jgi:hypothetical protein
MPNAGQTVIQERAYAFWEREGRPHGRDLEHWLRAEEEIHRASAGRTIIDDNQLCELYRLFQEARRSLGDLYPAIRHDDGFLDRCRYDGPVAMLVVLMVREHILTATNTINRFSYDIRGLTAWNKVFASATETERMQALYEFLSPTASYCLSMPYAIKQMFIKSICQISHQTNRFNESHWDERALPPKPNFPDAVKLATRFSSCPVLCASLSLLDDKTFRDASDDYRSEFNHGFPRRIEIGYTTIIRHNARLSSYELRDAPPLLINNLIPLLAMQHKAASDCHHAYIDLIKEQHKLWPSQPLDDGAQGRLS